jgi:peroxiredoxin-like protein
MAQHQVTSSAAWNGGLDGSGMVSAGGLEADLSIPKRLGGAGTGTNPEEMLVATSESCYMLTLATTLKQREVPFVSLKVDSKGAVSDDDGLHFDNIVHEPTIVLAHGASEEQRRQAEKAAQEAGKTCMVSRSIAGNIDVLVKPYVQVEG